VAVVAVVAVVVVAGRVVPSSRHWTNLHRRGAPPHTLRDFWWLAR